MRAKNIEGGGQSELAQMYIEDYEGYITWRWRHRNHADTTTQGSAVAQW